jgi:transcriptional regulator with XRE-family HTH domain
MAWEEIIFPNNIRRVRLSKGMRMTQLAKKSGLSLSAMSKVEKGVRRLNQKQLMTVCGVLGCKLSDVFIKESDEAADIWKNEMGRRLNDNETSGLKIFGAGIRHLRRDSGKTIAQTAAAAEMTLSVYHKLETGQREIYENEVKSLAAAFGLVPDEMFKKIAALFKSGALNKQITKSEEKVRSVLVPGSPMSGLDMSDALYGAKIYDSARKKLAPVFGMPGENGISFKKSDEKMIVSPMNLEGRTGVYAVIPNVRRMGSMFPARSYLFVDAEAAVQPGDMAIMFGENFSTLQPGIKTTAHVVALHQDDKGNFVGQMAGPDEKVAIKNPKDRLHKVIQIVIE